MRPRNLDACKWSIISRFPTLLGLLLQVERNMGRVTSPDRQLIFCLKMRVGSIGNLSLVLLSHQKGALQLHATIIMVNFRPPQSLANNSLMLV
jgi:hypothetical protein